MKRMSVEEPLGHGYRRMILEETEIPGGAATPRWDTMKEMIGCAVTSFLPGFLGTLVYGTLVVIIICIILGIYFFAC